jgi:hypothetical protein
MKKAEHAYKAPATSGTIPAGVVHYLDGNELLTKTQALRLSTVDVEGRPHAAVLSAGDMVVMPSGRIRLAFFPAIEHDVQSRARGAADDGTCS